ncbi:MAG TPA: hypothetical protein VNU66_07235 [Mycobacteriales bacterium]|nr:hypothetical protein [Mycobacteriales bacterium]
MATLHCPLCGLRYARGSELDLHARDDHAPPPAPESQVRIPVVRPAPPGSLLGLRPEVSRSA